MRTRHTLPPIFVVGSGRSGTTWIGETIASCSGCISIFEPLHPKSKVEVPRWSVNSGLPGPYLRNDERHTEWEFFFDALLSGELSSSFTRRDWTRVPRCLARWRVAERVGYRLAKLNYQSREMNADRYVIKEIRANLMLDWLAAYTGAQIVFLMRHPCAVIGSRMQRKELGFEADTDEILCQPFLMSDFLERFRNTIHSATTSVQRQAVLWCVENYVPLSQAGSKDFLFCCYEEFVADRDAAFGAAVQRLGLEPTSRTEWAKNRIVSSPSHDLGTSRSWHAPLSEAEGEEVLRICEEFGLMLYGRQSMPLISPREFSIRDGSVQASAELDCRL